MMDFWPVAVFSLALLDSINPSALLVSLLLLATPSPGRKVAVYVATVFTVYLLLGLMILLGLGAAADVLSAWLDSDFAYGLQLVIGALMLGYALMAPDKKDSTGITGPANFSTMALIALGMTVTLAEAPTAIPYLAALGILTTAELPAPVWVPVLVTYNLIFITPPLLLLALQSMLGERVQNGFARLGAWLKRSARETFLWILGIVGFQLLASGLAHFEFFGLMNMQQEQTASVPEIHKMIVTANLETLLPQHR
jgi:hypothetical protein